MRKIFLLLSILVAFMFAGSTCNEDNSVLTGTIKYIGLEGGFFGIIGDDGKNYDPVNLPDDFRKDNLKVEFKFKEAKDQVSFHMWGTLIEIISIKQID